MGPDVQHYRKVHEIVKLTRELYLVSYRFVEAFTHIVLFLIMLYISEISMEILYSTPRTNYSDALFASHFFLGPLNKDKVYRQITTS